MIFGPTCLKLLNCELCSSLFSIPLCVCVRSKTRLDCLQLIKFIIKEPVLDQASCNSGLMSQHLCN